MLLTILAQARKAAEPSAAFEIGETIAYVSIGIFVVLMAVNTKITLEAARRDTTQGGLIGFALFLSVLVPLILLALVGRGFITDTGWLIYVLAGGAFTWVMTLICFTIVSSGWRKAEASAAPAFSDADVVEDVIEAVESPQSVPATIPIADSDEGPGRASQQTLKRMSMEDVEQASAKGPRAGELPENPILPDEVVKIRCLACDKKMQAEGPKFAKQRRCPNCKAAPFRYVTAV